MRPFFITSFSLLCSCFIFLGSIAQGTTARDRAVEAELISSQSAIIPGEVLQLGLRLKHDPHWHTYWRASATGYATEIEWHLPAGFSAGPIQWPVPRIYEMTGFIEYVYEDEVILPIFIQAPQDLAIGSSVTLNATTSWLMCSDVCIPGDVEISITLPVAIDAKPTQWAQAFSQTVNSLPRTSLPFSVQAWTDNGFIYLEITGDELPEAFYYFDGQFEDEPLIIPTETQKPVSTSPSRQLYKYEIDSVADPATSTLYGLLHPLKSSIGYHLEIPIAQSAPENAIPPLLDNAESTVPARGFFSLLLFAFLGGLILNLMPCVFPVIGIKIMGFVNQAGEDRKKIMLHGLTFSLGVLLSFWILAITLLILRSGGEKLGWGFQLQDPAFVFALTAFLFLFALNMSGLFEFGTSAMGAGSSLSAKQGFLGSFFSGVLATVVATPCAAPFLAPALGAALALPAFQSLTLFTFIAIGLALPYLLLSIYPKLIEFLPRPGPWMESFKQGMAFLLYATVAYLLWVLVGQLTEDAGFSPFALLYALFALILCAVAVWIYGRWGAPHQPAKSQRIAKIACLLILGGGLFYGWPSPSISIDASEEAPAIVWGKWSPGKPEQLAAEGKTVYVDFTARWCVTCQSNKAVVFSSTEVRRYFAENNIVTLKADWTNRDDTIAQELEKYGRSAVPFNLVYHPNNPEHPTMLPELLTPDTVLNALK